MINTAIKIVIEAFHNKKDKSGKPYLHHLFRVATPFIGNDILYEAALLHDLIEDCPEWTEQKLREIFPDKVVNIVTILTHDPAIPYDKYIDKIMSNKDAAMIKQADLIDNMDITRLKTLTDKAIKRLIKYHRAYIKLSNFINKQP